MVRSKYFGKWRGSGWCKYISFHEFCEYRGTYNRNNIVSDDILASIIILTIFNVNVDLEPMPIVECRKHSN